jgi:predicted transcriptional regulator
MDKKQKEALVLALAEKGKTYREITKEVGVSPNTIIHTLLSLLLLCTLKM